MSLLLNLALFGVSLAVLAAAILLPLPLAWQMAGVLVGLLVSQLAIVGSFRLAPARRRYLRLRRQTDRLIALVRELNEAAVQARAVGLDPHAHVTPILRELHRVVDDLADVAGVTAPPPPQPPADRPDDAVLDPATAAAWKAGWRRVSTGTRSRL